MNRRAFITGLGAVLAAPLVAEAQPAVQPVAKIARFCRVDPGVTRS
jgi:hypothetical protein